MNTHGYGSSKRPHLQLNLSTFCVLADVTEDGGSMQAAVNVFRVRISEVWDALGGGEFRHSVGAS